MDEPTLGGSFEVDDSVRKLAEDERL